MLGTEEWRNSIVNPLRLSQVGLTLLFVIPLFILCIVMGMMLTINGYLIALLASLFVLVYGLLFYRITDRRHQQMGILADLLEALIQGDFSLRGKDLYSADFQQLLTLVNQLAEKLQSKTQALQENQRLLEQVIEHMEAALLAVDHQGHVIFQNNAATKLIQTQPQGMLNELLETQSGKSVQITAAGSQHQYLLQREAFRSQGRPCQLIVLSHVETLLHQQEVAAWQRLLRVIAHEINNSMTPIHSISSTMLRSAEREHWADKNQQALKVIQDRSQHLIGFIERYSKVAKLPQPNKSLVALGLMLNDLARLFPHRNIAISGEAEATVYADPAQLQQVLINLLKNADEAMTETDAAIELNVHTQADSVIIRIRDQGPGISNPDNLFVPFYTTKTSGSGIGLMLSKQIILNHYGQLNISNRQDSTGAEACIQLPTTKRPC